MNPKVRVTIEYLEPVNGVEVPPAIHEFHTFNIRQERPVYKVYGPGRIERLVPSTTTVTTITASHTEAPPLVAHPDFFILWVAPGATDDQIKDIKVQIQKTREDPEYTIVTNHEIYWLRVYLGQMVVAEEASPEQVDFIVDEIKKLRSDGTHLVVLPFRVCVQGVPTNPVA